MYSLFKDPNSIGVFGQLKVKCKVLNCPLSSNRNQSHSFCRFVDKELFNCVMGRWSFLAFLTSIQHSFLWLCHRQLQSAPLYSASSTFYLKYKYMTRRLLKVKARCTLGEDSVICASRLNKKYISVDFCVE